ncbi:hypothetical protein [Kribbella pratensis]|nr:hypothetical protein [Kribbella pratensis]
MTNTADAPNIEVLIPITTLLGMDDDPCELTGYGRRWPTFWAGHTS